MGSQEDIVQAMAKLMEDMKDPEFKRIMEQLGQEGGGFGGGEGGEGDLPMDESLASTLQMLAKMSMVPGMEPEAAEAMGEEVLKRMADEFGKMGTKDDVGPSIDNMMRQLLSKDIMYIPLQQTCEKYPMWLAAKEASLSTAEYDLRGKQYQVLQKIVNVYETTPDDFPKLMELMNDLQETGQLPAEIIKELAPGGGWGRDLRHRFPCCRPLLPCMSHFRGHVTGVCVCVRVCACVCVRACDVHVYVHQFVRVCPCDKIRSCVCGHGPAFCGTLAPSPFIVTLIDPL